MSETMSTVTLVEFLRVRLDEDEQAARAAGEACIAWLTYRDDEGQMRYTTVAAQPAADVWVADGRELPAPARALVVYDPARVLAEVEAKRRRLARHTPIDDPLHGRLCSWCSIVQAGAYQEWPCPDVRDDLAVYASHPDYEGSWRP